MCIHAVQKHVTIPTLFTRLSENRSCPKGIPTVMQRTTCDYKILLAVKNFIGKTGYKMEHVSIKNVCSTLILKTSPVCVYERCVAKSK